MELARTAAALRDADFDLPGRAHLCHTTPGSALLFLSLCRATGASAAPEADPDPHYCTQRTAMMPRRRRTRNQNRATRIATERRHNRDARLTRKPSPGDYFALAPPPDDEEDPPPF
ncbi:hypothetical protein [Mycobacterium sp. SMC-2]|uniref:hypothetical protein n=1 Tax=Mycobacterium sp. SMC-2 TaxID=2857058 RepID=UPI0037CBC749